MSDAEARPAAIRRIAVIGGGGLMGHGLALACIAADPEVEVLLLSHRQESLDHGMALIRGGPFGLDGLVRKGRMTAEAREQALARVLPTLDYGALARADLVFESVPEVVATKHRVLRQIEDAAGADAIVATNTSSITLAELGSAMARPQRLIGTHWFYPANVMPLVEVVRSESTTDTVVATTVEYLKRIRKKPVVVRDAPGFFTTRFINLFIAEAMRSVEAGICGIAEVDEMVKTGLGWPMGVFELLDKTASFDSWYHAQEYLHSTLGERWAVPAIAREVFNAGFRGAPELKPGSRGGWYDYFGKECK